MITENNCMISIVPPNLNNVGHNYYTLYIFIRCNTRWNYYPPPSHPMDDFLSTSMHKRLKPIQFAITINSLYGTVVTR